MYMRLDLLHTKMIIAITEELGLSLENITLSQLGSAKRLVISKDSTTIISGSGAKKNVNERIKQITVNVAERGTRKLRSWQLFCEEIASSMPPTIHTAAD